MIQVKILIVVIFLNFPSLFASEYYVNLQGDDINSGLSREQAFRTIQNGVNQLKGGDILTIGPGEYFESVFASNKGMQESQIVIRAEIPGSVLIRGDKPVSGFQLVEGQRFTYAIDWTECVNAVIERDTLSIYLPAFTMLDLEFSRGLYWYDRASAKLYISTTDGKAPDAHVLTVSVKNGSGLMFASSKNILIDGLLVTGFYSIRPDSGGLETSCTGIGFVLKPEKICVQNCRVFLNGNGIILHGAQDSIVENCIVYGNGSPFVYEGGNLVFFDSKDSRIVNCSAFRPNNPQGFGIRFYGRETKKCLIDRCRTFGDCSMDIKTASENDSLCRNSYSDKAINAAHIMNNVRHISRNAWNHNDNTLVLEKINSADWNALFADPENHDFRPQGNVKGIENGLPDEKNICFIAPDGDDSNDGISIKRARKTFQNIKSGTTVYLLPGNYGEAHITADYVTICSRGNTTRAHIRGEFHITGKKITLKDLDFTEKPISFASDGGIITCCVFAAKLTASGKDLQVTHNVFTAAPDFSNASGVRHSNLASPVSLLQNAMLVNLDFSHAVPQFKNSAAGDFTLKNPDAFAGRGLDALPQGPYKLEKAYRPIKLFGPYIYSVTATTANIEWWTDIADVTSEIYWGEDRSCSKKSGSLYDKNYYHSVTLTGLTPGKQYFFKVASRSPAFDWWENDEPVKKRITISSEILSFLTSAKERAPYNYHVAKNGSDKADGTEKSPWKTINHALEHANAGDTVIIHEGIYSETLYVRTGGDKGRFLTIRSAPGEKVWIDGAHFSELGVSATNKSYVVIDGIYFRNFLNGLSVRSCCLRFSGGDNITVRRCFYDGRTIGHYTPVFINAAGVTDLSVENCVVMCGFRGALFARCPGLSIRNNVWYVNQIKHFIAFNTESEKMNFRNNLFIDLIPMKYFEPLIETWDIAAWTEYDNCFYMRSPEAMRLFVSASAERGKTRNLRLTYPDYIKRIHPDKKSIFRNPELSLLKELNCFKTPEKAESEYKQISIKRLELKFNGEYFEPLDFNDFFASEPECVKRKIGLEPDAFSTFKWKEK